VYNVVCRLRLHYECGAFGGWSARKGDDDVQGESSGGPAKERYDRKRPVVSFRVSRDQLEKLDELIKGSGLSRGRFLRRAFGLELEKKDRIRKEGHEEGYFKAKEMYAIHVTCDVCGEPILLEPFVQAALNQALKQTYDLYHKDCRPQILRRMSMVI
jgi:hypothetical protein